MARHKMPTSTILAIREDSKHGATPLKIAQKYGLARSTIYKIIRGDTYPEVGGYLRPHRPRLPPDATAEQVKAEARARLIARCRLTDDGCWEWTHGRGGARGYFTITIGTKTYPAHRLAYMLFVGPIPPGAEVDHECHNRDETCFAGSDCRHRRCIRPDHLRAVSHAENVRAGRSWSIHGLKTHCPAGHPYDAVNTRYTQRKDGGRARVCKQCTRDAARRRRELQRRRRSEAAASA